MIEFLLLTTLILTLGGVALASDGSQPTTYSSLIRTISRNKVLWQVSEGSCHSALLVNMSSSEPLWQRLPLGSDRLEVIGYGADTAVKPQIQ